MVKRIHYQRNSTVLISEIGKYVIDINTPDKFHRLRMLHSVLSTTGLLTLIEGHRTEPIMTEENTHGFKNRKIILVPRVEYEAEKSIDSMASEPIIERVVLEEDDAFYYIHDNNRLFSLVCIMYSKTMHYDVSTRNEKLRNGIESYRDMMTRGGTLIFGKGHFWPFSKFRVPRLLKLKVKIPLIFGNGQIPPNSLKSTKLLEKVKKLGFPEKKCKSQ